MADQLLELVLKTSNELDIDILAYFGNIRRPNDDFLIDLCRSRAKKKNVVLLLSTRGGDPNAAYRMAKCLQMVYSPVKKDSAGLSRKKTTDGKFYALVNGPCKSAGTLMVVGADHLYMTGNAELGPLDIQLRKPDEVGERTSGLTPAQAITHLETAAISMFKSHFTKLRFDGDLVFSTKMAAEISTSLTTGLLSPIYAQIDPIRLAEVNRSLAISSEYADRLERNFRSGALKRLVAEYPSHGFVIDREEAKKLFNKVDRPPENLFLIAEAFKGIAESYLDDDEPFMMFLNDRKPEEDSQSGSDQMAGGDTGGDVDGETTVDEQGDRGTESGNTEAGGDAHPPGDPQEGEPTQAE